jgi:hypothetical protein
MEVIKKEKGSKMAHEEIDKILANHKKWLNNEEGGIRANLSNANLEEINLKNANLMWANLEGANLSHAKLKGVDLSCANLMHTKLAYANLKDANLEKANLYDANLEGVNLTNANLSYVCLHRAIGNNKEVKSLQLGKYLIVILTGVMIYIGCEEHSIEEWEHFTDEEIENMDKGALKWWKEWKEMILKVAKKE